MASDSLALKGECGGLLCLCSCKAVWSNSAAAVTRPFILLLPASLTRGDVPVCVDESLIPHHCDAFAWSWRANGRLTNFASQWLGRVESSLLLDQSEVSSFSSPHGYRRFLYQRMDSICTHWMSPKGQTFTSMSRQSSGASIPRIQPRFNAVSIHAKTYFQTKSRFRGSLENVKGVN